MLAEIILLRLDMALRMAEAAGPVAASRFVPLPRGVTVMFKKRSAAI